MRLKRGFSSAEAQRQVEAAKEKVEIAERRAAGDEALKREREEIERSIAIAKASWK